MSEHGSDDPSGASELTFERYLLRSADADGPAEGATERAWAVFAAATGSVALATVTGGGHGVLRRALHATSVRWLLLGALGGGALTAAWLGSRRPSTAAGPASNGFATVPAPSAGAAHAVGAPATLPPTPIAVSASASAAGLAARRVSAAAHAPSGAETESVALGSTLGAEIGALDGVRAALAGRAFKQALGGVARYHHDFPAGQLAPDAEALAIEALAAAGERDELARRAARFLARYPGDPHAARVRVLAAAANQTPG